MRSAPNLGWGDLPLQARLAASTALPVHVANDANVAVLAEHGATDLDDLLLIKVGHGVGAGLIVGSIAAEKVMKPTQSRSAIFPECRAAEGLPAPRSWLIRTAAAAPAQAGP